MQGIGIICEEARKVTLRSSALSGSVEAVDITSGMDIFFLRNDLIMGPK